jgi:hypothetical protein
MRRGPWHQFGDKSQKLALEQLKLGIGVGVVISPRDLSRKNAIVYAQQYIEAGADILIDQQFYFPGFSNEKLASYAIDEYRTSVSDLCRISDRDLARLSIELHRINSDVRASAVVAPAVLYEAGRPEIIRLNERLFQAAKQVGSDMGIPTYATVMLGRSVTGSDRTINEVLAHATALDSDGWYYGFELDEDRIPSSQEAVLRCCATGLTLACTGKPVFHAYAGPMALLSLGFGATGAGVGHSQNLWQFTRERWEEPTIQGGGGDAPPRFFSSILWGTIIYPDEVAQLAPNLRSQVLTHSHFSVPVSFQVAWGRWEAYKHFVYTVCSTVSRLAQTSDARTNANAAISLLQNAIQLHTAIASAGLILKDASNSYQGSWLMAISDLLRNHSSDFDYLSLLQ